MSGECGDRTLFVTLANSADQRSRARLLVDSIRAFGGPWSQCPVWLFDAANAQQESLESHDVRVFPLAVPEKVRQNWFAPKVCACAQAEALVGPAVRSLIWFSHDCLIIQPPHWLDLGLEPGYDAAVRPVHVKNIGLDVGEPLDEFWRAVYAAVGVKDVPVTVESFVDGRHIRAYYNSHTLSVNPAKGLFRRWYQVFESRHPIRSFNRVPARTICTRYSCIRPY